MPAAGGSVTIETVNDTPTIRPQITQMSGHDTLDSLIQEAPSNTNTGAGDDAPYGYFPDGRPRKRKPRAGAATAATDNPLMDDPQYRKSIAGLNFYGAPRIIKRGFNLAATVSGDETLDLDKEETEAIDNYFYAVSKHIQFDPMATFIGRLLLLLILIGELVMTRLLMRTSLGRQLKEFLEKKEDSSDETETASVQDNGSVRSSGQRQDVFS